MFSTLRNRFGIPGVISVIALVFAMFGGAYAASNSSGGGKATASAKQGKQGKPGKTGKTGPTGPAGPVGPAGPAGAAGPKGDAGAAGSNGSNGSNGTSASATSFGGSKGTCTEEQGGIEVKSASPTAYVCNGTNGEAGEPWTAGGTLPSEATETGALLGVSGYYGEYVAAPISFPIPLSAGLDEEHILRVHLSATPDEHCENAEHEGTASAENPEADPGYLCIYESATDGVTFEAATSLGGAFGAVSTAGGLVLYSPTSSEPAVRGAWAVTAP